MEVVCDIVCWRLTCTLPKKNVRSFRMAHPNRSAELVVAQLIGRGVVRGSGDPPVEKRMRIEHVVAEKFVGRSVERVTSALDGHAHTGGGTFRTGASVVMARNSSTASTPGVTVAEGRFWELTSTPSTRNTVNPARPPASAGRSRLV